ncbi:hypothetical protein [Leclercia sp.]|uniref:hypothetical protein n=1 Tax=Leclercia sp. TaxID=1898428 RepID=UPI0028AC13AA|nr:hypothetical protein [Leclercia sp.]
MGKSIVHVLIPFTTKAACGQEGFNSNGFTREQISCKKCRKTKEFKDLNNSPKVKNK